MVAKSIVGLLSKLGFKPVVMYFIRSYATKLIPVRQRKGWKRGPPLRFYHPPRTECEQVIDMERCDVLKCYVDIQVFWVLCALSGCHNSIANGDEVCRVFIFFCE